MSRATSNFHQKKTKPEMLPAINYCDYMSTKEIQ